MKTYSRNELVQKSANIFKAHNVSTLFATVDGQFFIHKSRANTHNSSIKSDKVYEIDASELESIVAKDTKPTGKTKTKSTGKTNTILKGSNAEVEKTVSTIEDVDLLKTLLKEETENKKRAGAIKSIEDRIASLTKD